MLFHVIKHVYMYDIPLQIIEGPEEMEAIWVLFYHKVNKRWVMESKKFTIIPEEILRYLQKPVVTKVGSRIYYEFPGTSSVLLTAPFTFHGIISCICDSRFSV